MGTEFRAVASEPGSSRQDAGDSTEFGNGRRSVRVYRARQRQGVFVAARVIGCECLFVVAHAVTKVFEATDGASDVVAEAYLAARRVSARADGPDLAAIREGIDESVQPQILTGGPASGAL